MNNLVLLRSSRQGSALLMVLWVISVLSFLIVTTLMIAMQDVEAVTSRQVVSRARQLAESGLAIGAHTQVEAEDPLLQRKLTATESFEVQVTSEESRLNINLLLTEDRREILERLFTRWGLREIEAESLIDAMMDWVDADDLKRLKGAETDDYRRMGLPVRPLNRPFRTLDEVALVPGMGRIDTLKPDWRHAFTLWGDGRLNVNEARADLIAAVLNIPLSAATGFVQRRDGLDGRPHTADDLHLDEIEEVYGLLGMGSPKEGTGELVGLNGYTPRIESIGRVGNCTRGIAVTLSRKNEKPQILEWNEFVPEERK